MNRGKLILVRHGLSVYNDQNRFTGWKDIDLNEQGVKEAIRGLEGQVVGVIHCKDMTVIKGTGAFHVCIYILAVLISHEACFSVGSTNEIAGAI